MSAMVRNDHEKKWMKPMLDLRNALDFRKNPEHKDHLLRDFRRMGGNVTMLNGQPVPGPYTQSSRENWLRLLLKAQSEARRLGRDVLIVDTAGRLAIDSDMMAQVRQISEAIEPHYTFLVIDAMTGQDAVNVAKAFDETLAISGVILSKLDGDARGGAALSVKEVIGKPIAFAATGEKLDAFEQFHPDRMASRILGMGDMLTLIEQAEKVFEKDEAEKAAAKLMEGEFTLDDFLDQLQQLKKMGNLSSMMGMLPGMPKEMKNAQISDDMVKSTEAIIRSMTPEERRKPEIINGSRRQRIATGSGTQIADVNKLVKQFSEMQKMMKRMGGGGKKGGKGGLNPFGGGGMDLAAALGSRPPSR
mgnify:CR=1 FL=1